MFSTDVFYCIRTEVKGCIIVINSRNIYHVVIYTYFQWTEDGQVGATSYSYSVKVSMDEFHR